MFFFLKFFTCIRTCIKVNMHLTNLGIQGKIVLPLPKSCYWIRKIILKILLKLPKNHMNHSSLFWIVATFYAMVYFRVVIFKMEETKIIALNLLSSSTPSTSNTVDLVSFNISIPYFTTNAYIQFTMTRVTAVSISNTESSSDSGIICARTLYTTT